ncbi:MAG: cobalamin biosynthesis protein CobD [Schwartzia sp.]|nr:cobalamin biosynthesis protein CobD [Schwartzia sp. (in: firmicutes)]
MMVAILAFAVDYLIGDPRSSLHPVVLIGKLISFFEGLLYHEEDSDRKKLVSGFVLMVCVLAVSYGAAEGILWLAALSGNLYVSVAVQAVFLSFMISPRNLAEAGREIRDYLLDGNLEMARFKVGWIVGRDTDKLTEGEATRATVETISENTVDGVISPLFYFFIGGLPLAVAYRAANTMDSMVGYKNDKYLFFGRAAARADDAWNYIPARLTGVMFVVAAFLLGLDWRGAWRMMRRDSAKHPSPNGGWTESTVAGALGIRLGGLNYYFGKPSFRTYMGDPVHELEARHISLAIRLMYTVTVMFLVLTLAASWLLGCRAAGGLLL